MTIDEAVRVAGIEPYSPEWETATTLHALLAALSKRLCGEDGPQDFFVSEFEGGESQRVYDALWVFTNQLAIALTWSINTPVQYRVYPKRVSALKSEMTGCNPGFFPRAGVAYIDVTFGTGQQERIRASGLNVERLIELLGTHLAPK